MVNVSDYNETEEEKKKRLEKEEVLRLKKDRRVAIALEGIKKVRNRSGSDQGTKLDKLTSTAKAIAGTYAAKKKKAAEIKEMKSKKSFKESTDKLGLVGDEALIKADKWKEQFRELEEIEKKLRKKKDR